MSLNKINFKISNNWVNLLDICFPKNSIFQSISEISPATLFGGTWTQIIDKMIESSTNFGLTGGEATVTLKAAQVYPKSHNHTFAHQHNFYWTDTAAGTNSKIKNGTTQKFSYSAGASRIIYRDNYQNTAARRLLPGTANTTYTVPRMVNDSGKTHAIGRYDSLNNVSNTGNINTSTLTDANATTAHNNMPPYKTVYGWYRTDGPELTPKKVLLKLWAVVWETSIYGNDKNLFSSPFAPYIVWAGNFDWDVDNDSVGVCDIILDVQSMPIGFNCNFETGLTDTNVWSENVYFNYYVTSEGFYEVISLLDEADLNSTKDSWDSSFFGCTIDNVTASVSHTADWVSHFEKYE